MTKPNACRHPRLILLFLTGLAFCGCASKAGSGAPAESAVAGTDQLRFRQEQIDTQIRDLQTKTDKSINEIFTELRQIKEKEARSQPAAAAGQPADLQKILATLITRLDRLEGQIKRLEANAGSSATKTAVKPPVAKKQPEPKEKKPLEKDRAPKPPATTAKTKTLPPDLAASLGEAKLIESETVSGFGKGEWGLGAAGKKILDRFAAIASRDPKVIITLTGFGDQAKGNPSARDEEIAWRRADSVGRYLATKGIKEDAVLTVNGESTARTSNTAGLVEISAWRK